MSPPKKKKTSDPSVIEHPTIAIYPGTFDPVTNGPRGLLRIDPPVVGNIVVDNPLRWYYLILTGIVISVFIAYRLNHSRIGRAWIAMREDQDAAAVTGINILKYKLYLKGLAEKISVARTLYFYLKELAKGPLLLYQNWFVG